MHTCVPDNQDGLASECSASSACTKLNTAGDQPQGLGRCQFRPRISQPLYCEEPSIFGEVFEERRVHGSVILGRRAKIHVPDSLLHDNEKGVDLLFYYHRSIFRRCLNDGADRVRI